MKQPEHIGHVAALVTVLIWGTTFISTKVLLEHLQPVEILLLRFVLGWIALLAADPHPIKGTSRKQEFLFAAAGLCGVCLYYLLENIALTYTMVSNVGVIVSVSPCFTAILSHFLLRDSEPMSLRFFAGFLIAIMGIGLISFHGAQLQLDLRGDLLALLAALVWAGYSVLSKRIGAFGYPAIRTTRRIFTYGILWMLPACALFGFHPDWPVLAQPVVLGNLLYLGLGASALCFVTWGVAVQKLGPVKTSVYIYMIPVITLLASALILQESVTTVTVLGMLLTLTGLVISQKKQTNETIGAHHGT